MKRGDDKRKLLLVALPAIAIAAFWWQGRGPSGDTPSGLWGHWTTTSAAYAERAFTLDRSRVAIYTGPADSAVYEVRGISRDEQNGVVVHTIHYADAGELVPFTLVLGGGTEEAPDWLYFPNQPEIEWRRGPERP